MAMASNLRKAGQTIRKSFRTRSYTMFHKENVNYIDESPAWRKRRASLNESFTGVDKHTDVDVPAGDQEVQEGKSLKRGASVTQSMREAVGSLRQKLRMSTRRHLRLKENQATPPTTSKRRHSFGVRKRTNRDVQMSSPFKIDTPTRTRNQIRTCLNMETPTRLTREVEDLTSNMQALSSLTPNSLKTRSTRRRQSPPLTNGSLKLKTPKSTRRHVTTDIF